MFININENEYELSTKLGISVKIEKKFRLPLTQVFDKIASAEIDELVDILAISANKLNDKDFKAEILDNWDYVDLQSANQRNQQKMLRNLKKISRRDKKSTKKKKQSMTMLLKQQVILMHLQMQSGLKT